MSDFVFKKETIAKSNFYTRIKEILVEAGWQSIASRPTTEFDVFYSEGEEGNRGLYFQMKEYDYNSTSNPFSASVNGVISFRLVKGYTPSATVGSAGTFERTDTWRGANLTSNMHQNSPITFYHHCNLNRLIVFVENSPSVYNGVNSSYFTIGVPDTTFGKRLPKHDLIFATSQFSQTGSNGSPSVFVTDQVDNPKASSYKLDALDSFASTDAKSLSISNKLFFSEVAYGGSSEGVRGILDGVYLLKDNTNNATYFWLSVIKQGDEFIDGDGKRYRILSVYNAVNYSSFSTKFIAFRVE